MKRVGVTGGIGSGKSLVCRVFETLKIPVYYADEEARGLTDSDPEIRRLLTGIFGEGIYEENRLNRTIMAQFIFKDKLLLDRVNQIIHPRVTEHFNEWCHARLKYPYIIHESAIIYESKAYKSFDRIVAVVAPEEIRLQRVMIRPFMTPEKFRAILLNQLPGEELSKRADHVIINDDKTLVVPQIIKLHHYFLSL
jgi:dephospho-CoA kinase